MATPTPNKVVLLKVSESLAITIDEVGLRGKDEFALIPFPQTLDGYQNPGRKDLAAKVKESERYVRSVPINRRVEETDQCRQLLVNRTNASIRLLHWSGSRTWDDGAWLALLAQDPEESILIGENPKGPKASEGQENQ